jgi:hypothetical protein
MTCRPGHPPRHPDFERGNVASVKHNATSARRAEAVAAEVEAIAETVAKEYPWTAAYRDERLAYGRALVDERDVRAYLDRVGNLDEHFRERPAVRTLERFHGHAARCRAALGLNPAAHSRLLVTMTAIVRLHPDKTVQAGLDALLSEGRAALERGSQRLQEPAVGATCPHGDRLCPCQDGDLCHYEGQNPLRCPTTDIVGCTGCRQ